MLTTIMTKEVPVCLSEEDKEIWHPFTNGDVDYVIVRLCYNDVKKDYHINIFMNHPEGKTNLIKLGFTEDEKFAKMVFAETCDIIMTAEFLDDLVEFYDFEW